MSDVMLTMVPSGEGAGGRGFRWSELFGHSSSSDHSEPSVNQPYSPSPEPAAPPAVEQPEVFQPLLNDVDRRQELSDRLDINCLGRPLSYEERNAVLETQEAIERKMEEALRSDRYSANSILSKRHDIRGILFYPQGKAFSLTTYQKYLHFMQEFGTHRSLPYQRLMEAIYRYDLTLER